MSNEIHILCIILFLVGLYGVTFKKNLIKIIISFIIMDNALNLFFITLGYRTIFKTELKPSCGTASKILFDFEHFLKSSFPIFLKDKELISMVDPLPQALVLTSIVIGLSITILMVALAIRIYEKYGTLEIDKIKNLKG